MNRRSFLTRLLGFLAVPLALPRSVPKKLAEPLSEYWNPAKAGSTFSPGAGSEPYQLIHDLANHYGFTYGQLSKMTIGELALLEGKSDAALEIKSGLLDGLSSRHRGEQ